MQHAIVYAEPGRFAGWPANNGIWSWGDEILVAFATADYVEKDTTHSVEKGAPRKTLTARSTDGGETWKIDEPQGLVDDAARAVPLEEPLQFDHPDFALRVRRGAFVLTYDRGHTWQGPFQFPMPDLELTSRTDYLALGPGECLFGLSAKSANVNCSMNDRAFFVRTSDGGLTFSDPAWVVPETDSFRSVMPSTVMLGDGTLVTALRRKQDADAERGIPVHCWIDAYGSEDGGRSWHFLNKVAEAGDKNGNPPALVHLQDGRLAVAYGYRSEPFAMHARVSSDGGKSWSEPVVLRDDPKMWDFGYPRMAERSDGKLVTVYYFNTPDRRTQHIAATVWSPDELR